MRYLLIFLFLLKLYHCLDINDINSSDVFEAVSSGNMVTLKNILDEDSFIINSVTTDSGLSPLMLGVSQNKYSVVELLINRLLGNPYYQVGPFPRLGVQPCPIG